MILAPPESPLKGNLLKSVVQDDVVNKIFEYKNLVVEGYVGFGKTRIGLKSITRLRAEMSNPKIIILVPNTKLQEDWTEHTKGISNVFIYTLQYYTIKEAGIEESCDLLIVDEAHRVLNSESEYFSTAISKTNTPMSIILSGSISKKHKSFLKELNYHNIYLISKYWGFKNGLVPQYYILNIPVELTLDEKVAYVNAQELIDKNLKVLARGGIFDVFRSPPDIVDDAAELLGWSTGQVRGILKKTRLAIAARSDILYNAHNKLVAAQAILDNVKEKAFIFCKSIDFANKLAELSPLAIAYHSKVKDKTIFDRFLLDINPHLVTVNKIKEGVNVEEVRFALRTSSGTSDIDVEQIIGRVIRLDKDNPNKEALLVSLYVKEFKARNAEVYSQERNWLEKAQKKERNPIWCNTLEEGIEFITKTLYG